MMLKDWEASVDSKPEQPEEAFQLEPEGQGQSGEPWIDEAIHMFGEDLVIIKE